MAKYEGRVWLIVNNEGKFTYEDAYFDQNEINIQLGYTLAAPK